MQGSDSTRCWPGGWKGCRGARRGSCSIWVVCSWTGTGSRWRAGSCTPGSGSRFTWGGALERASKAVGAAARVRDEARLPPHRVVYADEDVLVVDKPAGLLTAPTPESDRGNLLGLLGRQEPVFLVHRIDLHTSGLLVFARNEAANRSLAGRFRTHDVTRVYQAVLVGDLAGETHRIDLPVGGRPAVSYVTVLERLGPATLVEVRLETGRTHQIRIHASSIGHPVAGDPRYGRDAGRYGRDAGRPEIAPPRLALHARILGFAHPRTGEDCLFTSDWPADLSRWLEELRRQHTTARAGT